MIKTLMMVVSIGAFLALRGVVKLLLAPVRGMWTLCRGGPASA